MNTDMLEPQFILYKNNNILHTQYSVLLLLLFSIVYRVYSSMMILRIKNSKHNQTTFIPKKNIIKSHTKNRNRKLIKILLFIFTLLSSLILK